MSRFYCPFCSFRYQFPKTSGYGDLICGQCGETLVKKPLVNLKRILGVVASSAFLTPLLIMVVFIVNDFTKEKLPKNSESLLISTIDK